MMRIFGKIFKKYGWSFLIVICLILSFIVISKSSLNIPILTKYIKVGECKEIILGKLKSPTTAKFSDIEYTFQKSRYSTGLYVETESGVKMEVQAQSGYLHWTYTSSSGEVSSGKIIVLSGGYLKTQEKIGKKMLEDDARMKEISDKIPYSTTSDELHQYQNEYYGLSTEYMNFILENYAIITVIKGSEDIIILGNVDSQNGYGAMIRTRFHCEQVKGEEMFGELLE